MLWKWRGSETGILFLENLPNRRRSLPPPNHSSLHQILLLLLTDGVLRGPIKKVTHIHLLWTVLMAVFIPSLSLFPQSPSQACCHRILVEQCLAPASGSAELLRLPAPWRSESAVPTGRAFKPWGTGLWKAPFSSLSEAGSFRLGLYLALFAGNPVLLPPLGAAGLGFLFLAIWGLVGSDRIKSA